MASRSRANCEQAGFALSLGIRRPGDFADPLAADDEVLIHPYDARDRGAATPWVDATIARFGRIDVLVNNAGISRFVGLEDGSEDDLDELFAVNVTAPFRVIRAALPHLKAVRQRPRRSMSPRSPASA